MFLMMVLDTVPTPFPFHDGLLNKRLSFDQRTIVNKAVFVSSKSCCKCAEPRQAVPAADKWQDVCDRTGARSGATPAGSMTMTKTRQHGMNMRKSKHT
jgi:hypothetical protein